jgi:hypothetical protein
MRGVMLTGSLIERLRAQITLPLWCREVRSVHEALGRLVSALDREDHAVLDRRAREAFIAALALAQMLVQVNNRLPRPIGEPGPNRRAVDDLLDALDPYVTQHDRTARRILLGAGPLDALLERVFWRPGARVTLR